VFFGRPPRSSIPTLINRVELLAVPDLISRANLKVIAFNDACHFFENLAKKLLGKSKRPWYQITLEELQSDSSDQDA
jgi:hypothetical protein